MLKKLLTGCLTIVAAAALAVPAMAAEMSGKVGGRAAADLLSVSKTPVTAGKAGDAYSYMDMVSEGRLSYMLTATEGDWTAKGLFEIRSSNGTDFNSNPVVLQKYVQFENEAVAFALGLKVWGFVYLTPYMGVSSSWDRFCYGCYASAYSDFNGVTYRDDRLNIVLKQVGLQLYYSAKTNEVDSDADGTKETYQKTAYGLQYDGNFGPLTLVAAYQTLSTAAIENFGGGKDKPLDGYAGSELSLAVRYAVMEGMFVEGDYNSFSEKIKDGKDQTNNTMGLAFAMALSETQGFVVSYDQQTYNSGVSGAKDKITTEMVASFNQKIAGQQVWVAYEANSSKDGDADAATGSTIALGGRVSF